MTVRLLYFASFREHVGSDAQTRQVPDGTSAGQLWRRLAREVPHFAVFPSMPPVAVNGDYAESDTVLREGDEVAFLPPVAGG
ncbi:MAG TPA: molybdopterin converting factor subunit 1 [Thermoanaerobaculia bacterium]|nr:molybdopterin converting factor subunit 1 [Thermoanaerobaculia bacterium]